MELDLYSLKDFYKYYRGSAAIGQISPKSYLPAGRQGFTCFSQANAALNHDNHRLTIIAALPLINCCSAAKYL